MSCGLSDWMRGWESVNPVNFKSSEMTLIVFRWKQSKDIKAFQRVGPSRRTSPLRGQTCLPPEVSSLKTSPGISEQYLYRSECESGASEMFLRVGGRPALSSGFRYGRCQENHLSHSLHWLLIRECWSESTSTESRAGDGRRGKSFCIQAHRGQIHPHVPSWEEWSSSLRLIDSWWPFSSLNYMWLLM